MIKAKTQHEADFQYLNTSKQQQKIKHKNNYKKKLH